MWLLPTRNRPDSVIKLIKAMESVGSVPDVAVMIDGDESLYSEVKWPSNWCIHSSSEHLEMQRAINTLFHLHPSEKTYGILVDHIQPIDSGWWEVLEESAGDWNIAFNEDDTKRYNPRTGYPRMNGASCIGGELARALGYVWPDFCVHLAGDDAIEEIGYEFGLVKSPRGSKVNVLFHTKGQFKQDANHQRMYQGKNYAISDLEDFQKWRREVKPDLMARLDKIIPKKVRGIPSIPTETHPVTFVCLKVGTMYSAEYVNILKDMVTRNLVDNVIDRFVCITDDATGLDDGIDIMHPPGALEGWWGKLWMFQRGLFRDGTRMVYMDLDTIITGRLDNLFKYMGKFAGIRDFYHPTQFASGIMMWEAGQAVEQIWDSWVADGMPRDDKGDQWYIGKVMENVDYLQDIYPGKLVSYKKDCKIAPPSDAAIICFHGVPRPHQVDGWVANFWKIGGYTSADFDVVCNTILGEVVANIKNSSMLGLPSLSVQPETNRRIVICGGGPSIEESLEDIRKERDSGSLIVGLNGSAQWLHDRGIEPDWMVMIDSRRTNYKFVLGYPAKQYFISSQCDSNIFELLDQENVTIFHIDIPRIEEYVYNDGQPIQAVGGGSSVGLIAMSIAYTQGYRDIHLYGFDSSYRDDEGHAYIQNQEEDIVEAVINDRKFKAAPWMVIQTTQFQPLAKQLLELGCTLKVHGDGLLPYLAWTMMNNANSNYLEN